MSSHFFFKHSHKFLTNKLNNFNILLLNKCENFSNSAVNRQFKKSEYDKQPDIDQNILFPENKHNKNERADTISKAMLYYLEKLNERGIFIFTIYGFIFLDYLLKCHLNNNLKIFFVCEYRRTNQGQDRRIRDR